MVSQFNPASRYERELDRLISAIEGGGAWPPAGSKEHALLKRAMRKDPVDRKQWAVDRIAKVRPDKLTEPRAKRAALVDGLVSAIEAGGAWPAAGTRERVMLLELINPAHPLFKQDVFDRIGDKKPSGRLPRRGAAETASLEARILTELERTRVWPRWSSLEGRLLRAWVRPGGSGFRRSVWDRVSAILPDRLDSEAFAALEQRIVGLIEGIERGQAWPAKASADGKLLVEALTPDGAFFDEGRLARLQAASPDALSANLPRTGRKRRRRPVA